MIMKLFTSDWNSNPCDKDLNPAKTHDFQLRSQTWFQDLKKLRFLTSHCRTNSVRDFTFLDFKITADGDCSHEIKRCLFLGRKAMNNLDGILKSRDITLPTKVHLVKAMVFPVVMYGCESWTIKKAEC